MYIIPEYSSSAANETYHGLILTLQDALLVLEGTRQNLLYKVRRRLNDIERKNITLGSVFAWSQTEGGMKRWTDGKTWLASKIKGPFLIYHEQDENRNPLPNGLVKQTFSLTTKQNEKLNLVCYYNSKERADGIIQGKIPSEDPLLVNLQFDPNVYLSSVLQFKPTDSPLNHPHQAIPSMQMYPPGKMVLYAPPYGDPQFQYYLSVQPAYYYPPLMLPYPYMQAPPLAMQQSHQMPQLQLQQVLQVPQLLAMLQVPQPLLLPPLLLQAKLQHPVYIPRLTLALSPYGDHMPLPSWSAGPQQNIPRAVPEPQYR